MRLKVYIVHHHLVQCTSSLGGRSRCTVFFMAYPAKTDRRSVLAAAMEQVESEGVENLAIRSVAAKLGVAPNALYRYFESLAALEAALAEEARLQMLGMMQKAAGRKGPSKTIRAISEAYLRFAQQRPRLFALYLKTSGANSRTPQCTRNTEFFLEQVTRVYGEERAWKASHFLWAFLHGLAVLLDAGVLPAEEAFNSLHFGLQIWIDGA
jgi:AcrR family transcriptional regulator